MSLLDLLKRFFGNGADDDAGLDNLDHGVPKRIYSENDEDENGDCRCIYCHTDFWYEDHIGLCTSKICSNVTGFRMDLQSGGMASRNGPRQILLRAATAELITEPNLIINDRIKGQTHTCPVCRQVFYFYACPHCRYPVPHLYKTDLEHMIAPAGIVKAGKTVFMTVLIQTLLHRPINKDAIKVISKFTECEDYNEFKKKYKTLFTDHKTLVMTDAAAEPLPYLLRTTSRIPGEADRHAFTLWYDFSGESLTDGEATNPILQYFRVARGIFFLVDPVNSPDFVARDPELVGESSPSSLKDLSVIMQISNLIEKSHRGTSNPWQNKLIAVIVNKVDLFRNRETNFFNSDSIVWSPSPHDAAGAFCVDDYNQIKVEVKNYLEEHHPALFGQLQLLANKEEDNIGYFAVSSLGHAPKAEKITEPVEPIRITDPFYWMLWRMGQMSASGYSTLTADPRHVGEKGNMGESNLL